MSIEKPSRLLITGGGTGGHVLAGVAVADEWKRVHEGSAPILFVGALGAIEEKLVPRAGYELEVLRLGALNATSLTTKIRTLLKLPLAFIRSALILRKFRPDAILGVGGYASGPLLLTAWALDRLGLVRCRRAILEQNSVPGFTNRILGKFVETVFCAFPGTEARFPGRRTFLTGNPIRSSMKRLPSAPRDPFTIFIFGGSQGAAGINTLILESLPHLLDLLPRLRFIHQTGERDFSRVTEGYAKAGVPARVEKFIHDMPSAYSAASLLICRAGSSTLAEVAAVGRAAVLVPFPFASDNHQQKNAEVYSNAGAATLMIQGQAKGADLAELIRRMVTAPETLAQTEETVAAFYRPGAAQEIVRTLAGSDRAQ